MARPRTAVHGTRSKYVQGCHCALCEEANRLYQREYMKKNYVEGENRYSWEEPSKQPTGTTTKE